MCGLRLGVYCRGGKAFVATQALGWALFSVALACLFWLGAQVAAGMAYCIRCWVFATSSLMFFAQLVRGSCLEIWYMAHDWNQQGRWRHTFLWEFVLCLLSDTAGFIMMLFIIIITRFQSKD
jgi:hypothetical protein